MPPIYQTHPSTRVLDYLKRMEVRAEQQHNRWAALHYSLVHAFVFDHVHGSIPDFSPHTPDIRVQCDPGPRRMTLGQVEMLKRPIRKIVRRLEHTHTTPGTRLKTPLIVEVLECGHQMPERVRWFDEPLARRRRCAQCVNPARGAAVEAARRAHA